jgi:hypothetical protein
LSCAAPLALPRANPERQDRMTDIIQQLGDDLDAVDAEFHAAFDAGLKMSDGFSDICHRHFRTCGQYFGAARVPLHAIVKAFENSGPPRGLGIDLFLRYYQSWEDAKQRLDTMNALGSAFYTAREHCDAEAAEEHTEELFNIVGEWRREQRHNTELFEKARKSRTVKRVRGRSGSRVKYVLRDGIKIPVVEKTS